ncbi:retroviral-like aspartic protease family protein [Pseudanabaena sp. FACHB-1998]|uniref:retropepsin-like aspartic protease family protein n=1 Tax=Pseudanabaena sp. FACHB-1998 TaxID=2692858 RepID=UPI00168123D6|nr:retropepsin-like aspartic protease [Pseudanabaena sp. FACHB-1998]MBD2179162.1 retroviral-like aspartic protease family protein [Pseudanabaena sp. FACHB-1998]
MKPAHKLVSNMVTAILLHISLYSMPLVIQSDSAIAQDSSDCFMINSRGQRINLSKLCSGSYSKPNSNLPPTLPNLPSDNVRAEPNGTIKIRIKRFANKIPIIDVVFNGNLTYEMIFDTGASHTLITAEMAQALNVVAYNYANFNIADGSNVKFGVGEVKSIELGSFKIQVMPVVIAKNSNIGLLGHDFFGKFDIKIGQSEIELSPRKLF